MKTDEVMMEVRSGSNSMVESQPSKLLVASSILVSRSILPAVNLSAFLNAQKTS